jgi:hypothetical protein
MGLNLSEKPPDRVRKRGKEPFSQAGGTIDTRFGEIILNVGNIPTALAARR